MNGVKRAIHNDMIGFLFRNGGKFYDYIFEEPEFIECDGRNKDYIFE